MIISKTPFRVSLFGGSTDYESYYSQHGSFLIGFTINRYCYLCVRKTPKIFNYKTKVGYSAIEIVNNNKDIKHDGVRGVLKFLKIKYGVEISYLADLPSKAGIGSSSSFIVGLLNALHTLNNRTRTKKELAEEAIERELSEFETRRVLEEIETNLELKDYWKKLQITKSGLKEESLLPHR